MNKSSEAKENYTFTDVYLYYRLYDESELDAKLLSSVSEFDYYLLVTAIDVDLHDSDQMEVVLSQLENVVDFMDDYGNTQTSEIFKERVEMQDKQYRYFVVRIGKGISSDQLKINQIDIDINGKKFTEDIDVIMELA